MEYITLFFTLILSASLGVGVVLFPMWFIKETQPSGIIVGIIGIVYGSFIVTLITYLCNAIP